MSWTSSSSISLEAENAFLRQHVPVSVLAQLAAILPCRASLASIVVPLSTPSSQASPPLSASHALHHDLPQPDDERARAATALNSLAVASAFDPALQDSTSSPPRHSDPILDLIVPSHTSSSSHLDRCGFDQSLYRPRDRGSEPTLRHLLHDTLQGTPVGLRKLSQPSLRNSSQSAVVLGGAVEANVHPGLASLTLFATHPQAQSSTVWQEQQTQAPISMVRPSSASAQTSRALPAHWAEFWNTHFAEAEAEYIERCAHDCPDENSSHHSPTKYTEEEREKAEIGSNAKNGMPGKRGGHPDEKVDAMHKANTRDDLAQPKPKRWRRPPDVSQGEDVRNMLRGTQAWDKLMTHSQAAECDQVAFLFSCPNEFSSRMRALILNDRF